MTKVTVESATPIYIASQYSRDGFFFRFWSVVEATIRAVIFARRCERHFNRHGRISPQAMTQIAERTGLARAD